MITQQQAEKIAHEWINAWNSNDINAIIGHYSEDVELTSPFVASALGIPSGTIRGKDNVRTYFEKGLAMYPGLRFKLLKTFAGVDSVVVHYQGVRDLFAAELMTLNAAGQITKVTAHYELG